MKSDREGPDPGSRSSPRPPASQQSPRPIAFSPTLPESELHVIRLRGPWQYQVLEVFAAPAPAGNSEPDPKLAPLAPLAGRGAGGEGSCDGLSVDEAGAGLRTVGSVKMPADWGSTLGSQFRGRVLYRRRFGCPTGLTSGERVELVVERADSSAACRLNGRELRTVDLHRPLRVDVTDLLEPRNLLEIEVACPAPAADGAAIPRGAREQLPGGLIGEVRLEIHQGVDE